MGFWKELKFKFWLDHVATTREQDNYYYNEYVKEIEAKISETYEPVFENNKGENAVNIFKMMTGIYQPLHLDEYNNFIDYISDYEYLVRIERFLDQYTYALQDLKKADAVAYNWIMERIDLVKKAFDTPILPVGFTGCIYAIATDNVNKEKEKMIKEKTKPRTF